MKKRKENCFTFVRIDSSLNLKSVALSLYEKISGCKQHIYPIIL